MSDSGVRALTLGLIGALALYCASRLELTNSITHFLPSGKGAELVELSLQLVDSPLARRMVLAVGGGPERTRVAGELAQTLASHPEVAWVEAGFDSERMRGLYDVYFDRRLYLASERPALAIPAMLGDAGLASRAALLRRRLAGPASALLSRTAPQDPLGLFDALIQRITQGRPALSSADGWLVSRDGEHAIVLLGLRSSPFDSGAQRALLGAIHAAFQRLGGGLVLEQSGVNRIAVASERSIRADVNFISAMSITGVCALFLLVFRSLRHLLVAILTPLAGFAAATAVEINSAGPVHGITLGFGFALIGVAIDYPIHLMNHHALAPPGTPPRDSAARIRGSLLLSGATTTLAFLALALSDFPGLGDMGLFASVGVPAALAVTLLSLPAFLRPGGDATAAQRSLAAGFEHLVAWLTRRRALAAALPLLLLALAGAGVPQLHWQDDPASLMAADPQLLAEDERVRSLIADVDSGRFVLALGADPQQALERNDLVYARLEQAVAAGQLEGMRSLHSFLWSEKLQRENLAAFQAVPDLGQRIERAFGRAGFRPGAFRPFAEAVAQPPAPPLLPRDLRGSPLEHALDSLAAIDGRWVAVTYLRHVHSGEGIRAALAGLEGVHYVDQAEVVAGVYEGYRRSTLRMIALGGLAVLLLLALRYRSPRSALLAFLPSALVAVATLGLFGLLHIPVNVVAAISLVIVLGMGVDYGIFAVDTAQRPERVGATLSSLLVSCLTTLFVFGTLALSAQPALRAIGLTTGTGILLALLLAPAVLVLASGRPR